MDIGVNTQLLLVAFLVSVISPIVLAFVTGRERRKDKLLDWDRLDAVEKRAADASKALLESNERIAAITFAAGRTTQGTLEIIHKLVNSKLTEEKQERYESLVTLEASVNREIELLKTKEQEVPRNLTDLLKNTREHIVALGAELVERRKQQNVVDLQVQNLADQLALNGLAVKPFTVGEIATPIAPKVVDVSDVPTVEAPVRVIVPGSGEKANSTVEKK